MKIKICLKKRTVKKWLNIKEVYTLDKNFYTDIFKLESNLTKLIKSNLLNVYYLNGKESVRDFYYRKYQKLLSDYNLTKNEFLLQFLEIIKEIIEKIDYLTISYKTGSKVDMTELLPLLFSNRINNIEMENNNKIK